ncbi:MAG: histidine phosphatase family protein [Nanoarchaeota archaeon]
MKKLTLIRHGESTANRDQISQGQSDYELSELGIVQAKKLANRLKNHNFDIAYISDLKRAKQTAEEILTFHKIPTIYDKRLRERAIGNLEGKPRAKYLELKEYIETDFDGKGESYFQVQKRVKELLDEILCSDKKDILIVAHGGVIKVLLYTLFDLDLYTAFEERKFSTENTCVYEIELNDKEVKILTENCTLHLD